MQPVLPLAVGAVLPLLVGTQIDKSDSQDEADTWTFLKLLFEETPRKGLLNRLGFDAAEIERAVKEYADAHAADHAAPVPEPAREQAAPEEEPAAEPEPAVPSEPAVEEPLSEPKTDDVSDLFGGSSGDPFGFGSSSSTSTDPFAGM